MTKKKAYNEVPLGGSGAISIPTPETGKEAGMTLLYRQKYGGEGLENTVQYLIRVQ